MANFILPEIRRFRVGGGTDPPIDLRCPHQLIRKHIQVLFRHKHRGDADHQRQNERNGQHQDAYIHKALPSSFFQQPPQTATSLHQNKSPKASRTT